MPTMSNLPNSVRGDERSATSSPYPSADCTTATFTEEAMNALGGRNTRSSRSLWPPTFGIERGKLLRTSEQSRRIGTPPKSTVRVLHFVLDTSAHPQITKRSQFLSRRRNDLLP